MSAIATVDISRWHAGGAEADALAAEVDEGLQRAGFIVVTGHGVDPDLAARVRAASREFFALPDDGQAAVLGPGGRARLDRSGGRGQRLRRGHRDAAGPQGELQPGCRDRDRRPGGRPNLVRAQRLAGRGARAAAARQRVHRGHAPALRRPAGVVRPRARAAGEPVHEPRGPPDLDDEHQPLPAGERGRRAGAGPVPHRPAHRLRHRHGPGP